MKRIISLFSIALAMFNSALAQDPVNEGAPYYLPKTAFKFRILVQKTTFTPGEYAEYASRYLKQSDAVLEPKTSYKIKKIHHVLKTIPFRKLQLLKFRITNI